MAISYTKDRFPEKFSLYYKVSMIPIMDWLYLSGGMFLSQLAVVECLSAL